MDRRTRIDRTIGKMTKIDGQIEKRTNSDSIKWVERQRERETDTWTLTGDSK